jgi:hypothetical protein
VTRLLPNDYQYDELSSEHPRFHVRSGKNGTDQAALGPPVKFFFCQIARNGRTLLNLDAFAPAAAWDGIGPSSVASENKRAAS